MLIFTLLLKTLLLIKKILFIKGILGKINALLKTLRTFFFLSIIPLISFPLSLQRYPVFCYQPASVLILSGEVRARKGLDIVIMICLLPFHHSASRHRRFTGGETKTPNGRSACCERRFNGWWDGAFIQFFFFFQNRISGGIDPWREVGHEEEGNGWHADDRRKNYPSPLYITEK